MSSEQVGQRVGVPIGVAAEVLGLNADAVRKRIRRGTLEAYKEDDRWYVVLDAVLPGVQDAPSSPTGSPVQSGVQDTDEPIEARFTAMPAEVERAIERTADRYVTDFAGLYDRITAELSRRYEAELAAKDAALSAKDETIAVQAEALAELRRRAEAAERERDELRRQAAPPPPSAATTPTTATATPDAPAPAQGFWARVRRAFGGG